MLRFRLASLIFSFVVAASFPAATQEGDPEEKSAPENEAVEDEKSDVDRVIGSRSGSEADCACPKEGEWKVQNLEGWMNCTGPFDIKRKIGEVKDEGTIRVLEEDCSSLFGEASRKKDEDVRLARGDSCGYEGTINGEEDGVKMSIEVKWTLEGNDFIKGEMHSEPSMQGMLCEYYRPFEIRFDEEIPEDDYEKRREKMQKKLDKLRKDD